MPRKTFRARKKPKNLLDFSSNSKSSQALPLDLPPKQDLGKVYKQVSNGKFVPLFIAVALAIITPIAAIYVQDSNTDNRSFASEDRVPVIKYIVIEDAVNDQPWMISDTPELVLSKAEIPKRINLRPETSGSISRVVFNLPNGQEIIDSDEPFTFSGDEGWEPIPGSETISITAYGTGSQASTPSNVYNVTLTIVE